MTTGTQYKAVIEYAPSQRVPRSSTKKDGRDGTIYKGNNRLEGTRWKTSCSFSILLILLCKLSSSSFFFFS